MEIIPYIYLTKQFEKTIVPALNLQELKEKHQLTNLYIIDRAGIEKNRPRFCFYQEYAALFDLWIDAGPRIIEDVVDDMFAGANRLVIRFDLWQEKSFVRIKELTDNEILLAVSLEGVINRKYPLHLLDEIDGIVIFITEDHKDVGFKHETLINQLLEKKPCYIFTHKNLSYWQSRNIKGYLKDITSLEG